MKKRHYSLLFAVLALPLLTNCVASEQDVKSLDLRLRSVDNRLQATENTVKELQKLQNGTVESLQLRQAEVGNQADLINTELLKLKGQLEESSFQYRTLRQENETLKSQLTMRLAEMQARVSSLAAKVDETDGQLQTTAKDLFQAKAELTAKEKELNDLRENRAKEAADRALAAAAAAEQAREKEKELSTQREITPVQVKKKPDAESAGEPDAAATQQSTPEQQEYHKAYALFQQKKYKQAYAAFNTFIENNPKSNLAANARFWMGDCLYNQKEYAVAILEYQKVITDFKNHPKAPAALLKQALAFEELKDKDTAKIIYQKLTVEYPDSEQAAVAKKKL